MTTVREVDSRLFVNVAGGAKLSTVFEGKFDKGDNKVTLNKLKADTDVGGIDVIEAGETPFGTLALKNARVVKGNPQITIHSETSGKVVFTTPVDIAAAVAIRHRIVVDDNGKAELSSKAVITNNSKTPIKKASLTITAGDNQNKFTRGVFARSMKYEAAADTEVSQVSPTVYRFDHPEKLNLAPKATQAISLFAHDFTLAKVSRALTFEGDGSYWGKEDGLRDGGPVHAKYRFQNNKDNGLGAVLPEGDVEVIRRDGTLLSAARLPNSPVGREVVIEGGNAFDIETKRQQTSFKSSNVRADPDRSGNKIHDVTVGQELQIACGKSDETLTVIESVPQTDAGGGTTAVRNVMVDGRALAASDWSIDENSRLVIPNITLKANKSVKVTFDVDFTTYRN